MQSLDIARTMTPARKILQAILNVMASVVSNTPILKELSLGASLLYQDVCAVLKINHSPQYVPIEKVTTESFNRHVAEMLSQGDSVSLLEDHYRSSSGTTH